MTLPSVTLTGEQFAQLLAAAGRPVAEAAPAPAPVVPARPLHETTNLAPLVGSWYRRALAESASRRQIGQG